MSRSKCQRRASRYFRLSEREGGATSLDQPVQGESVIFYVDISRAVVRIPRVVKRTQLRLVRGHRRQQIGAERLLRQFPYTVHPPHVVVLVIEEPVPPFAHQRAISQRVQIQI